MAKISLRAYNREIETLVERGQSDEAIAHCKFILKIYPKHLDTYRLLGKAFLESQRYSEAADILQRILSVQPDDFVSQIGMSIIREDEGNLDAALFHMERAFEIQPSNAAIQDELRRLYGRRDGVEPPKLRLTRGALVRMYARGDLYRQAIAEARAALAEDNQRVDINIILAKMYFLMGQKAEAAEISSKLVAKLPFCYEANRILADVLPETSRAEDAKIYQQRILSLDPYLGYISETAPSLAQVPDQAVTMDRLEWTSSLEKNQQPAWAKSLGIAIDAEEENKAEDWLSPYSSPFETSQPESPAPEPPSAEMDVSEPAASNENGLPENQTQDLANQVDELPSWMSSAGWDMSEQTSEKPAVYLPADVEPSDDEEAEPLAAEMPDWLKDLAPATESNPTPTEEQEKLDWLASILPAESSLPQQNIEVTQPNLIVPPLESAPAVLSPVNEDLPDWMRSSMPPSEEPAKAVDLSIEPLPDWLTESTELTPNQEPTFPVELESPQNLDQVSSQAVVPLEPSAEMPPLVPESSADEPASDSELSDVDDAMAWLESLAVKQGADEEALLTKPEDRQDQPPEWVVMADQSSETIDNDVVVTPLENEPFSQAESAIDQPETETQPEEPAEPQSDMEFSAAHEQEENIPANDLPAEPVSNIEAVEDMPEAEAVLPPPVASEEPISTEPASQDMDAAFAWLESLAAKQGAEDESLLSAPEERSDTLPEWVKEQSQEVQAEKPAEESVLPTEPEEWIPEWMNSAEENAPATQADREKTQELPAWLKALETSPDTAINVETFTSGVSITPDEEISSSQPAEALESADWVQENSLISDEDSSQTMGEEPVVAESKPSSTGKTGPLPHWLVAQPSEDVSPQPEPIRPESEMPELPNWLQEEQPSSLEEKGSSQPETAETPGLPEWLQNLEAEKVEVPLPETPLDSSTPTAPEIILSAEPSELIKQAGRALSDGHIDVALTAYNTLVQNDQHIEETIHDLKDALYHYPVDSAVWQTLGDALIRANRVQDALDAYTKAEELLK